MTAMDEDVLSNEPLRDDMLSLDCDWVSSLPATRDVDIAYPFGLYADPEPLLDACYAEITGLAQETDGSFDELEYWLSCDAFCQDDSKQESPQKQLLHISPVDTDIGKLCHGGHGKVDSDLHDRYDKLLSPASLSRQKRRRFHEDHQIQRDSSRKRPRRDRHTKDQVAVLEKWLIQNSSRPYPTSEDKAKICHSTGLSPRQVERWFAGSRQRKFASRDTTDRSYHRTSRRRNTINQTDTVTTESTQHRQCPSETRFALSKLSLGDVFTAQPPVGFNFRNHFTDSLLDFESGMFHVTEDVVDMTAVSQSADSGQMQQSLHVHVASPQGDYCAANDGTSSSSQDCLSHEMNSACDTKLSYLEGPWVELWLSTLPLTASEFVPFDVEMVQHEHPLHRTAEACLLPSSNSSSSELVERANSVSLRSIRSVPNPFLKQHGEIQSTDRLCDHQIDGSRLHHDMTNDKNTQSSSFDQMMSASRDLQSLPSHLTRSFTWECDCQRVVVATVEAEDENQLVASALRKISTFCGGMTTSKRFTLECDDSTEVLSCEVLSKTLQSLYDTSVVDVYERPPALISRGDIPAAEEQIGSISLRPADIRDNIHGGISGHTYQAVPTISEIQQSQSEVPGIQKLFANLEMAPPDFDDGASTAVSSVSSLASTCSFSSFGPRKGRKLPCEARPKLSRPDHVFQCTVCGQSFQTRYIWRRHEESIHHPQTAFICGFVTHKPNTTCISKFTPYAVSERLFFTIPDNCACHHALPEIEDCYHGFRTCWERSEDARTFFREDGLLQHIKTVHKLRPASVTERRSAHVWSKSILTSRSDLTCGFCQYESSTWSERMQHVGDHYEAGWDVSSWNVLHGESNS